MTSPKASALTVARTCTTSATRRSRAAVASLPRLAALSACAPETQASAQKAIRATVSTQAMGVAMTKASTRLTTRKGRSAISTAVTPDKVDRTVSRSRISPCQAPAGLLSSTASGSASSLSNSRRPTWTSMRRATDCNIRQRAWRSTKSKAISRAMPTAKPCKVVRPAWPTTRS